MNGHHEYGKGWVRALGFGLMLGCASPAAAAPPPSVGGGGSAGPEEQACAGRSVGDACTLPNRQLGTCADGTCNRLDYSQGSPPKATEEACVVCQAGGQTPHDGGPMLGSGGPPPDQEPGDGGSVDSSQEPPTSSSRCAVIPERDAGAGLVLGLVVLLGLGRVRQRSQ